MWNPPHLPFVIDRSMLGPAGHEDLRSTYDRVGHRERCAAYPFEPCRDFEAVIEARRSAVVEFRMGHGEMETHSDPFGIALVVGLEPCDAGILAVTKVVRVVDDPHCVRLVKSDAMDDRPGRCVGRDAIDHGCPSGIGPGPARTIPQKRSFSARIRPSSSAVGARMKGFVAFSSPIEVGIVISAGVASCQSGAACARIFRTRS